MSIATTWQRITDTNNTNTLYFLHIMFRYTAYYFSEYYYTNFVILWSSKSEYMYKKNTLLNS